ncbi:uroporphyrinogen-III C-methyltransferase [Lacrimispora sphenoides]|uniref:uroporphyrinogen-III C-methyltransferase n=1 Tax=Lacrimispora sphenoides JCM 1415 TaxID=1297793 RepID=A0ABY1CHP4_9FIRM|nr:uroporphyrinogen-III C-methyltransferase [Lacrimispora sphenoides]SEU03822.1 uroporphyrinogen III methyltransferase / synthase [[Clostridium] sphenoides JCM 1415]SUY48819.1 uroporphyrin-III C-methyltransferase [Lacrimispora sphenoides]
MMAGKVWLVGAGPSDPGLLTIKGKDVLEQAEVVVYDQLVGQGILQMIPKSAKKINVGKYSGNHTVVQERINEILLEEALEGKKVVRLKGGDPFLFGRGGEELELLCEHGIPYEIVPGITSAISVPAYAGIPVTHRDFTSSLHIITGHRKKGCQESIDYKSLAALGETTLVFLMGVAALSDICRGLIEAGMAGTTPAAILERGTTAKQRNVIATIATLPEEAIKKNIGTPGIIVVGKVCSLSQTFAWAEKRLLSGARVVVTRPKDKASSLAAKLYDLGAEVVMLSGTSVKPIPDNTQLIEVLNTIKDYKWILFGSEVAVDIFFDRLFQQHIDIRSLWNCHFGAVGPATRKAIEKRGIRVTYMPEKYYGTELGKGIAAMAQPEDKVLVLIPNETDSELANYLSTTNVHIKAVPVYDIIYEENEQVCIEETDIVTFTSASTVRSFVKTMKDMDFHKVQAVCIGELTAKEAALYGMKITVAKEATIDSLIESVIEINMRGSCH